MKFYIRLGSVLAVLVGVIITLLLVPEILKGLYILLASLAIIYVLHLAALSLMPSFYGKLVVAIRKLYQKYWPRAKSGKVSSGSANRTFGHQVKSEPAKNQAGLNQGATPKPVTPQPARPVAKADTPVPSGRKKPSGIQVKPVVRTTYPVQEISDDWIAAAKRIGGGGEAEVYTSGNSEAVKIFRLPDDDYYRDSDMDAERKGAKDRLNAYPDKLSQFPPWLGSRVIAPKGIITRPQCRYSVAGYSMALVDNANPLTMYANPKWKRKKGVTVEDIARIFLDLYDTVQEIHACGMLIGDFKPANVLVSKLRAFIVDAESAAFGGYPCRTFTEAYIDPRICNPKLDYLMIAAPYDRMADWYSFTVMLFKCLTNISPWDGSYTPPKGRAPVAPGERPLRLISVFNKGVVVPNFTDSISQLPQALQDFFYQVFEGGMRGKPDRSLIESLISKNNGWSFCPAEKTIWAGFGIDNGSVSDLPELVVKPKECPAGVLYAYRQVGKDVLTLSYEDGKFTREDGREVLRGHPDDYNHFEVGLGFSVIGRDHQNTGVSVMSINADPSGSPTELYDGPFYIIPEEGRAQMIKYVDPSWDGSPNFVVQRDTILWVHQGEMFSLKGGGAERKSLLKFGGSVKLFSGSNFGLAVTTIDGELGDIYCFSRTSISRLISVPPIMGNIQSVNVEFSAKTSWLFIEAEWEGKVTEYVMVLKNGHTLLGMAKVSKGDAPWATENAQVIALDESDEKNEEKKPKLYVFHDGKYWVYSLHDEKISSLGVGVVDLSTYCGLVYHKGKFKGLLPVSLEVEEEDEQPCATLPDNNSTDNDTSVSEEVEIEESSGTVSEDLVS
ncbi:MAG TPA: hypothetical protein PKA63_02465 [Oligoflexia bacterium]|nr:hypothetical protein [Oligoflexia bacterium]HMP47515.1 hypothetical protein [Oligoflexia bacterium]